MVSQDDSRRALIGEDPKQTPPSRSHWYVIELCLLVKGRMVVHTCIRDGHDHMWEWSQMGSVDI